MANPPFNQKQWRQKDELTDDPRWAGFTVPPTGNANYAWILHMVSKLSEGGTAGFVLANGSMSSNTSGEGDIRRELLEKDLVDCMVALPGQLFYTTQIPVCLWFLRKQKGERSGETLFIDARNMGKMIDRVLRELTTEEIKHISDTYHNWQNNKDYDDVAGYCKSATLEEIVSHGHVLTPGRYVGAAEVEDDGEPFEEKMARLTKELSSQLQQAEKLDKAIAYNLRELGFALHVKPA